MESFQASKAWVAIEHTPANSSTEASKPLSKSDTSRAPSPLGDLGALAAVAEPFPCGDLLQWWVEAEGVERSITLVAEERTKAAAQQWWWAKERK